MKLNAEELKELNDLLANEKIDIPDFRRSVTPNGHNYKWLQRNILIRNPNINDRLKNLLGIKVKIAA